MTRVARWILSRALPPDVRDAVLADLDTEYARAIRPVRRRPAAWIWYWRQAAGSIGPAFAMRRRRRSQEGRSMRVHAMRRIAEAGQDARFALRLLLRQQGFTAAVVATLALGLGATTAIFSVVDGVLLRPLPYRDASRLVRVWSANPRGIPRNAVSPANFFDWREQAPGFEGLAAYVSSDVTLTGVGDPMRLTGVLVTANLADVLGVPPLAGRWVSADDARGDGGSVVVIGERLWRDRLGGVPDVVGRALVLDGRPATIVGVMPASFVFPSADARLWTPLGDGSRAQSRSANFLEVVGRLAPGATMGAAVDGLRTVARRLEAIYPETNRGWSVTVETYRDSLVGRVRTPLLVLLAAVASVLLIACANVASLMLARGVARSRELAVRAALGASAGRLLRQQIVETSVLAIIGGAAGVILAGWSLQILRATGGVNLPLMERVTLDTRVLLVAAAASLGCGLLTALLPAVRAARVRDGAVLHAGSRSTSGGIRARQAIVMLQVAVATVLVLGSVLLLRSFSRLTGVDAGFQSDHALLADVSLPSTRYQRSARAPFFARALEGIRALPGVQAAGAGGPLPLSGQDGLLRFGVEIEGVVFEPGRSNRAYLRWATPGYFGAMGIAQRAGRVFQSADTMDAAAVAVVDAAFARRYFGDADPIGRRLRLSNEQKTWRQVIGVVGAVRQTALDREADPHVYLPEAQIPASSLTLVIRTAGDAAAMAGSVRDLIRRLDPELPVSNLRPLADLVAGSTASRRFSTLLLSVFAAVAVLLTLVGVYGVVSQLVAQSAREIGVRIAMGASGGAVMSLMLTRAVRLAVAGVAAGSLAAWIAAPALGGMVYGIAPRDPATLAGVAALLIAAAVLAAYVPARRLLRLDVVHALRVE